MQRAIHILSLRCVFAAAMLLAAAMPGCGRLASRSADGNMLARLKPSSSTAVASSKAVADDPFPSAAQAGIAGAQ